MLIVLFSYFVFLHCFNSTLTGYGFLIWAAASGQEDPRDQTHTIRMLLKK